MEWLLILVMMNPTTTPHILTISVDKFDTEIECRRDLRDLTEEANDTTDAAVLVCLKDIYNGEGLKPIDDGPLTEKMEEYSLLNKRYW